MTSYEDFVDRLVVRFDKKDPEVYFRDLAQLKQTRSSKHFINEFQWFLVMVLDMPEEVDSFIY